MAASLSARLLVAVIGLKLNQQQGHPRILGDLHLKSEGFCSGQYAVSEQLPATTRRI